MLDKRKAHLETKWAETSTLGLSLTGNRQLEGKGGA